MDAKQSSQETFNSTSKLPGITSISKESWEIYKNNFATFIRISLIPFITGIILLLVFGATAVGVGLTLEEDVLNQPGVILGSISLTVLLLIIPIVVVQSLGSIALIYAIKDRHTEVDVKEVYKKAFHKLISYWWISFLLTIIVSLGLFFFIIPGILFAVWYGFASLVLINEGKKGMAALKKSKEYISGRTLAVSFRLSVMVIAVIILASITESIGSTIFTQITFLLISPLLITYYYLLYDYCRKTKNA